MTGQVTLEEYLQRYSETSSQASAVAAAVDGIAIAASEITDVIRAGALAGDGGRVTTGQNSDGDLQRELDVKSDEIVRRCLVGLPIAALASEEMDEIQVNDPSGKVCVAYDPLDGSSNIDINVTVGTIFSILPTPDDLSRAFFQPGSAQLAAGFVTYGPQTTLVLTLGDGVDFFTLDPASDCFRLVKRGVRVPETANEFAINFSNHRHWEPPVRRYIDECLAGVDGPADRNFNMRWVGSLVAGAIRILTRGGVFLYPADARPKYAQGRLRLVYEGHPIAFLMEQAGGMASTGRGRVLDVCAQSLHERVPLIMGSSREVRRVDELHSDPNLVSNASEPLFARRGFFR